MTRLTTLKRIGENIAAPYTARADRPASTPVWEWAVGTWTGGVLEGLGMRALNRGNLHEFNHIAAALCIGNSDHSTGTPCNVPTDHALAHDEPIVFTPAGVMTPAYQPEDSLT